METAWRSLAEDENVSYAYVVVYSGRNPYEANFSKAIYDYKDPNLFHQDRKDRSIFPSDDAEPKTRTKNGSSRRPILEQLDDLIDFEDQESARTRESAPKEEA